MGEADTATNYNVLTLVAGIGLVRPLRRGVKWEEMKDTFETHRGCPEVVRALALASRVMRLLDQALTAGRIKREETLLWYEPHGWPRRGTAFGVCSKRMGSE